MFNIILKQFFSFNTNAAVLVGLCNYIKWHKVSREIQIIFMVWEITKFKAKVLAGFGF